jgi:hypothetical protein
LLKISRVAEVYRDAPLSAHDGTVSATTDDRSFYLAFYFYFLLHRMAAGANLACSGWIQAVLFCPYVEVLSPATSKVHTNLEWI